jgi:hypothetical protein
MRKIFLVAAIIGSALGIVTEANAQYYPWCATYNRIGAENCGFVTFAQCLANVRGIGGLCYSNPWFYAHAPALAEYDRPYRRKKYRR